ncbi:hypothetical protein [Roseomonas populi]|uniref:Uncharacterized protein n=1 Tax=Roseomonas populi TaxID=3121582 RepID=A0ABT1WXS9_9PROT|nr:hypothetical protein [Roseomonas pecuniae]MCR0980633.1 hypothetical protein [Roseomonas pecuniae]
MRQVTVACLDRDLRIDRGIRDDGGARYANTSTGLYLLEEELHAGGLTRFAPLLHMARDRYAALILTPPGGVVPFGDLRKPEWTVIALLGRGSAEGPDAWPQAQRLIEWAAVIVLQDTATDHYGALVRPAGLYGRTLLIETSPEQIGEWEALLQRLNRHRDRVHLPAPVHA